MARGVWRITRYASFRFAYYANIDKKDLILYNYPTDDELKEIKVTGLFLGHYLPWDGYSNSLLAQSYGFKTYDKIVEGSMVNYENLDNYQTEYTIISNFLNLALVGQLTLHVYTQKR